MQTQMGAGASTDNDTAAASIIDGEDSILARAGGVLLPRDALFEALLEKLRTAEGPVAVVAPSGSGKSTFMARAVQRLRDEYDVVRAVFVGGADGSTQLVRVLSELCASLDDNDDDLMPDDVLGLSGLLERRLRDLSDTKRVLLVVDAVNELEGDAALSLGWLPRRAGVVVTTIRGGANKNDPNVKTVLASLKRCGVGAPLVVPALSTPEQAALLAQIAGQRACGPAALTAVRRSCCRCVSVSRPGAEPGPCMARLYFNTPRGMGGVSHVLSHSPIPNLPTHAQPLSAARRVRMVSRPATHVFRE